MKKDIDSVSVELTNELVLTPLEKTLPPKLRYRYYKWLKQFHNPGIDLANVQKSVSTAFEHLNQIKTLKKHEIMTSMYESGAVRFDFGGNVPKEVKEAAMKWAKKRGLKAVEASLDKSVDSQSYVVYSDNTSQLGIPVKYSKV